MTARVAELRELLAKEGDTKWCAVSHSDLSALLDVAEAAQEWRTAAGLFDPRSPEVRTRAAKLAAAVDCMVPNVHAPEEK